MDNSSTTPKDMSLHLLKEITKEFSQKLGSGGYGEVYKGMYNGEEIAVKKLHYWPGLNDVQFRNEFNNLMKVRHKNIVRLVGYCYEIRHKHVDENGEYVFGKMVDRVLCFEYLQGSLDKHLYEESRGHDWRTRYKIIKGICEGLNYLHGLEEPMFHLDLKPANILLDKNMVPKIADFGLSRLFGGTQTHITATCNGTVDYMPPEYISKRQISNKYDVFSLGVIIIQIMAGPLGFSRRAEISSQEFIETVHKNWRGRIAETSKDVEEYCQQAKRCIEIALNCVDVERCNRPTIGDIMDELKKTETMHLHDARFAKFGPWGGKRGRARNITVAPHRLKSVTIYSAVIVDSLTFSYSDRDGHQHSVGPWGGTGGSVYTIQLAPSEFLMEISGTIGSFVNSMTNVVTSLTFVTNEYAYGPFGQGGGTAFRTPTESNGSIVGFFGHAGWYVDAIGVYVNSDHPTLDGEEVIFELETMEGEGGGGGDVCTHEAGLAKIGPWGGIGGMNHDIRIVPHRLESVTICSDVVVDSLEFSYSEINGQKHTVGPWGNPSGNGHSIRLGAYEFLMGVSGTVGPFDTLPNVITSLTFVTNAGTHGPFGEGGGTPFEVQIQYNGNIVGFFGRSGLCVEAVGVYTGTFEL